MNIQNALKKGQSILLDNNILSAKLDSEILMSQAIKKNKEFSSKREEILSMIWNMEEEIMGKEN